MTNQYPQPTKPSYNKQQCFFDSATFCGYKHSVYHSLTDSWARLVTRAHRQIKAHHPVSMVNS